MSSMLSQQKIINKRHTYLLTKLPWHLALHLTQEQRLSIHSLSLCGPLENHRRQQSWEAPSRPPVKTVSVETEGNEREPAPHRAAGILNCARGDWDKCVAQINTKGALTPWHTTREEGRVSPGFSVRKADSSDLHEAHMPRTLPLVFLGEPYKASSWS